MLFNSFSFLIFFPAVALVYFILPKKIRWVWLLVSSYYFYMSWNALYALLLFSSTLITWLAGILMSRFTGKDPGSLRKKKAVIAAGIVLNLGILAYFKYFSFLLNNISSITSRFNIPLNLPQVDIVLPVGISFYTFQALGYAIDVYRGDTPVEKNFFRYALFVSFFPQLVAGPIERSGSLLKQVNESTSLSYENLRRGFMMTLCGYFLKVVMADNIAVVVDTVFGEPEKYTGAYVVLATVLFAFQIYGDFGGYSLIARGVAKMLGFNLMGNFDAPYMSASVSEFWRRWHVSLNKWFRDYVYIPLGGNRKGTVRKYLNVMAVFLLSGLWHGASWNFVIWGGLNGIFQVFEGILGIGSKKIKTDGQRIFRVIVTFVLVDFTWLFFRAGSTAKALSMLSGVFTDPNLWVLFTDDIFTLGLEMKPFIAMVCAIFAVLILDIFKVKGMDLYLWLERQGFLFRLTVYALVLGAILTFGAWGGGFNENTFLYFQF
ncbi:MAG: MBOAT family protein [Lachnospiraceae bacterium]|nr:MBOAT family protein [Lachnospiraceae bacterium]